MEVQDEFFGTGEQDLLTRKTISFKQGVLKLKTHEKNITVKIIVDFDISEFSGCGYQGGLGTGKPSKKWPSLWFLGPPCSSWRVTQ